MIDPTHPPKGAGAPGRDTAKTDELVKPTITAVDKVKDANPQVFVGQFGGASVNKALADQDAKDSSKALSLSLPA